MDTVGEVNQSDLDCSVPRSVANFSVFFRPAGAGAGAGAPDWPGPLEFSLSEDQKLIEETLLFVP